MGVFCQSLAIENHAININNSTKSDGTIFAVSTPHKMWRNKMILGRVHSQKAIWGWAYKITM